MSVVEACVDNDYLLQCTQRLLSAEYLYCFQS